VFLSLAVSISRDSVVTQSWLSRDSVVTHSWSVSISRDSVVTQSWSVVTQSWLSRDSVVISRDSVVTQSWLSRDSVVTQSRSVVWIVDSSVVDCCRLYSVHILFCTTQTPPPPNLKVGGYNSTPLLSLPWWCIPLRLTLETICQRLNNVAEYRPMNARPTIEYYNNGEIFLTSKVYQNNYISRQWLVLLCSSLPIVLAKSLRSYSFRILYVVVYIQNVPLATLLVDHNSMALIWK